MGSLARVILVCSLSVVAGLALDGTTAFAKKSGPEVRDEPAPSGRGPSIDDRSVRSGRNDHDRGDSSGKGSGKGKHDNEKDSRGPGSGEQGKEGGRVVIRDDDRL